MRILILGCGRLGSLAAGILLAAGHEVLGVRRSAATAPCRLVTGDAAEPTTWETIGSGWQAVLLCATPGLRRGRDHGLDRVANLVHERLPQARQVCTGTTAVYGEAAGRAVAEDGPLAPDAGPLLAVEDAVLRHQDALVLRLPALVGAGRDRAVARAREAAASGSPLLVPGDLLRPFSVLHEADAAEIAVEALSGRLAEQRGILNAASPEPLSVHGYYAGAVACAGVAVEIRSDGSNKPSRAIDAARLHALLPGRQWRGAWE